MRNILVGPKNAIKIADFGMAKVLPVGQTRWRMKAVGKLPVRFLPPETLNEKLFSEASDVWAFGITMWEMMTFACVSALSTCLNVPCSYGETPYQHDGIEITAVPDFVKHGGRPKMPKVCPVLRSLGLFNVAHFSSTALWRTSPTPAQRRGRRGKK